MKTVIQRSLFLLIIFFALIFQSCSSDSSTQKVLSRSLVVKNSDEKEIKLANLIEGKKTLVLRLPKNTCSSCIEMLLPDVKRLAQKLKANNLVVLTSFDNFRDYVVFKENNFEKSACYNIESLGIEDEKNNASYFFVLDLETFKASSFFYPAVQNPSLAQNYLSEQSQELFDTEVKFY